MKLVTRFVLAAPLAALFLVACSERTPADGEAAQAPAAMPGMPERAQSGAEHMAQGTVSSVDRAAGTVTIAHGPVASAGWPTMTMSFELADPNTATELTPGQRVDFRFKTEAGGSAMVTQISPVE